MNIQKLDGSPIQPNNILKAKKPTIDKQAEEQLLATKKLEEDELYISDKAKKLLEKHEQFIEDRKQFLEELANLPDYEPDPRILCMQIAMRIISGDKIPDKDRQFRAENDPGMYSKAMLLQRQNDDPKKHKSLLPDEDNEEIEGVSSSSVESSEEVAATEVSQPSEAE